MTSETPATNEALVSSGLLAQVAGRYGMPRIAILPEVGPDRDHTASFVDLRRQIQGASVVLFPGIAPGTLDGFFHLRLAQVLRWEPPLPAISVVVLAPDQDVPDLAGGFAARFRSGWPFARCVFVTENAEPGPLTARLGLPVGRLSAGHPPVVSPGFGRTECGEQHTPAPSAEPRNDTEQPLEVLRPDVAGSQKIALQFQRIWGRCGSTTGFENQIESLVGAGFLTIRVFTDAASRRGATLSARLPRIVSENSDHAGAHINVLAVPDGPPIPIRATDHATFWATMLAATATCQVRDATVREAAKRADSAIANHLESVGPALSLAPRARLMLDIRDDRALATRELMRCRGRDEADVQIGEAAAVQAQASVLAIPDICGHVSTTEFERLGPQSRRSAILLPRIHTRPALPKMVPKYDVLVFGDEHPFNIASVRWFLDEVWRPFLAAEAVSVAIAGRVGTHVHPGTRESPNEVPLLDFLGFVDDLGAVRSSCRLTVVPDRHGTGTAVKTLATLAAGHPLVSTSIGLRGLAQSVSGMLPAHDEAAALAADVLSLLRDPERLAERRHLVRKAQDAIVRGPDHATLLRSVPRPAASIRAERQARWTQLTAAAIPSETSPYHFAPGTSFPMSGSIWDHQVLLDGWHPGEPWGRWTDGARASLRMTFARREAEPLTLELDLVPSTAGGLLSLTVDEVSLPEIDPVRGTNAWDIPLEVTRGKSSLVVTLHAGRTICPTRSGDSSDDRILGIGVSAVRSRKS